MVRNYKRKSTRQKWMSESMDAAVAAVVSGKMGYFKAASTFGIPQSTLERYVKKAKQNAENAVTIEKMGHFKCVFTEAQERELIDYLAYMEQKLFGLSGLELRSMAYQLAERHGNSNSFNRETKLAGTDWLSAFLQRHPTIAIRKSEATSSGKATGNSKVTARKYFSLLKENVDQHKLTAERIFNVSDTSITVSLKGYSHISSQKGCGKQGSVELGETVSAVICMSAAGNYVPPMLIFPRRNLQQEFQTGLPSGSWAEVHETGNVDKEQFLSWFTRFIEFAKPSKASPVMLLMDSHKGHAKSLDFIDVASENCVILLYFPPHCSHCLQPLDVSFFKPLSNYYDDEVRKWLQTHPGQGVTLSKIATIFGAAFVQTATMLTAVDGFKRSGAWPVKANVLSEISFGHDEPTDVTCPSEGNQSHAQVKVELPGLPDVSAMELLTKVLPDEHEPVSFQLDEPTDIFTSEGSEVCAQLVDEAQDLPSISAVKFPTKAKPLQQPGTSTEIEVCSPEVVQKSKISSNNATAKTPLKMGVKHKKSPDPRKLLQTDIMAEEMNEKVPQKSHNRRNSGEIAFGDKESDKNAKCSYCDNLYSHCSERWIICSMCLEWAHNSCAGIDSDDDEDT